MKILIIKGSPHKNGSSNLLAEEFIRGVKEAGHTVESFDVAHANIHPCMGCDGCGASGKYVQKDDMSVLEQALLSADMAVFVTPIYYFGMSAQLKTAIDRFYSFNSSISGRGLKTALIAAAWDGSEKTMSFLMEHYQGICEYLGFRDQGMVLGTGCGTPSMIKRTSHMKAAYQLGRSL